MVYVHFVTPIGRFITAFDNKQKATEAIVSEVEFTGEYGETIIIPFTVQQNSVIIIKDTL